MPALADHLARLSPGLLEQHLDGLADHRAPAPPLLPGDQRLQPLQPVVHHLGRHRPSRSAAGVPGRGEYLNEIGRAEPHRLDQRQRRGKVGLGLAGKADDEIRRQQDVGPRRADPLDQPQVARGVVACGSSPSAPGPSPTAPAGAGTASASARRRGPRSARRPCRSGARSCSGSARARRSGRADRSARQVRPRRRARRSRSGRASVISRTPLSTRPRASASIRSAGRLTSAPRV